MKRYLKNILLMCLLIACLLSFCSCNMLDEMKRQRFNSINGDNLLLEYQGKEYMALTFKHDRYLSMNKIEYGFVVDPEIPLLLIGFFGRTAEYDIEKDLICLDYVYYASEENYDKYNKILQEGKLDHYRLSIWTHDDDYNIMQEYHILDKRTVDLIDGTKDNVMGQELKYYDYSNWEKIMLDSCDSNNLIYKSNTVTLYHDISNNKYGIILSDDGDVQIIKKFPESGFADIRKLFEIYNGTNNEETVY